MQIGECDQTQVSAPRQVSCIAAMGSITFMHACTHSTQVHMHTPGSQHVSFTVALLVSPSTQQLSWTLAIANWQLKQVGLSDHACYHGFLLPNGLVSWWSIFGIHITCIPTRRMQVTQCMLGSCVMPVSGPGSICMSFANTLNSSRPSKISQPWGPLYTFQTLTLTVSLVC